MILYSEYLLFACHYMKGFYAFSNVTTVLHIIRCYITKSLKECPVKAVSRVYLLNFTCFGPHFSLYEYLQLLISLIKYVESGSPEAT